MLLVSLLMLIMQSIQQSTFIYFDQQGIQNFMLAVVKRGTLSQDHHLDIKQDIDLKIGSLYVNTVDIKNINIAPEDVDIKLDPQHNGLKLNLRIKSLLLIADTRLKVLGGTLIDGPLNIEVKNTEFSATIVFGRNEGSGALNFSLLENKLEKFNPGNIKFISTGSWAKQGASLVGSTLGNMILLVLKTKISSSISKTIQSIGSSIPAFIALDGQFQGVVIPLNLTTSPTIGQREGRFDFVCGQHEINFDNQINYFYIGISEACITSVVQQVTALQPSPLNVSAIAQQISEVTEINTKTLGGLFPGFNSLSNSQDIKFQVTLNAKKESFLKIYDQKLHIHLPINLKLFLLQTQELEQIGLSMYDKINLLQKRTFEEKNYTDFNLTAEIDISMIKAVKGFAMSINQMNTNDYEQTEDARKANLFSESNWEEIKEVGLSFGMSFANQVLYKQLIRLDGILDLPQIDMQIWDKQLRIAFDFSLDEDE